MCVKAIKTPASDQYSGNLGLGVTVGVILVLVMAVGVIYCLCRKHKQKRQKCTSDEEKFRDGLMQDKKNRSEEI
ncbi:hypothetical protein cypCar_00040399 [Cyprinus carpio]|nr:hypothetical protein cypCar_00040399 [Cyprinus carpio]